MQNLTLQRIREAHKKRLIDKNLKWFRSMGCTSKDFDLVLEAERFAEVDLQLDADWAFTSRTDLSDLPNWVKQLYWYELGLMYPHRERKKISLAGTINPHPDKYEMKGFPMSDFTLKGMAELEEYVEIDITNAADELDARNIATKELLQNHPEYLSVDWDTVDAH